MVEKAAKAVIARRGLPENAIVNWDVINSDIRTAFEAIQEPTLAMLQAGREAARKAHSEGVDGNTPEDQIRSQCRREAAAWRAMVGEMLK
jgi:ribonuclease PH